LSLERLSLERPVLRLQAIQPIVLALGQTMLMLKPVIAELLALRLPFFPVLRVSAVGTKLCHPVLRVNTVRTILLAPGHAVFGMRPILASLLMLGGTDVRTLPIRMSLPAFRRPILCVVAVGADLLARLRALGVPVIFDARPDTLRLPVVLRALAHRALNMALFTRLPLNMSRPVAAGVPLDGLPVFSAAAVVRLGLMAPAAVVPMRPRAGRSCDRHRSDSRGEKQPGHHKYLLPTDKTVRRTSPFQPLSGWNPQVSALA
jgi:hypothetical protein